jgi:hypothetical protein
VVQRHAPTSGRAEPDEAEHAPGPAPRAGEAAAPGEEARQRYVAVPQRGSEEALSEALGTGYVVDDPSVVETRKGWFVLNLWSQGGSWDRADYGCPGLDDFHPQRHSRMPHISENYWSDWRCRSGACG